MRGSSYVILLFATLFLTLGYTASLGVPRVFPSAHAASRTISLTGGFATGWNGSNPGPTISVTQGEMVTLNLVSGDGAPHTFVVDIAHAGIIYNPNCGIDKCSNRFSSSTTFTFTADMAAGTYAYYCSIHLQHMVGSLVVQSGSNGGPDFSATSNPTTLTLARGGSGSATVTLTSLKGFTGTVALTVTVSPSGPSVSLDSTSIALPSNGSASSTLTVSARSTGIYSTLIPDGAYTVTVTGTSGSASHSTAVVVNVGSTMSGPTSSMPMYGGDPSGTVLLAGVAIVIVLGIVATIAVVTSRRARAK